MKVLGYSNESQACVVRTLKRYQEKWIFQSKRSGSAFCMHSKNDCNNSGNCADWSSEQSVLFWQRWATLPTKYQAHGQTDAYWKRIFSYQQEDLPINNDRVKYNESKESPSAGIISLDRKGRSEHKSGMDVITVLPNFVSGFCSFKKSFSRPSILRRLNALFLCPPLSIVLIYVFSLEFDLISIIYIALEQQKYHTSIEHDNSSVMFREEKCL